ncbi:hypothetical protein TNCV_908721 [Trichonephila clavipes]|nr:hypothetical protein TNCV_908721 [Trichonephila clavipes]
MNTWKYLWTQKTGITVALRKREKRKFPSALAISTYLISKRNVALVSGPTKNIKICQDLRSGKLVFMTVLYVEEHSKIGVSRTGKSQTKLLIEG